MSGIEKLLVLKKKFYYAQNGGNGSRFRTKVPLLLFTCLLLI